MIRLANKELAIKESNEGYYYRAYAKDQSRDYQGAKSDYNKAIEINPKFAIAYKKIEVLPRD